MNDIHHPPNFRFVSLVATAAATAHAKRPRLVIIAFLGICFVCSIWVVHLPTRLYTDAKTLSTRGTDIAGRDQAVESLWHLRMATDGMQLERTPKDATNRRNLKATRNSISSFIFETLDPSENILDTPYIEFLCEIRRIINEESSWKEICPDGACEPMSILDLMLPESQQNFLKMISKKLAAKRLSGKVKQQCKQEGVPPCKTRQELGCSKLDCNATCYVYETDLCHALLVLDPTMEELTSMSALLSSPNEDEFRCNPDDFDFDSFDKLLEAFHTVLKFAHRAESDSSTHGLVPYDGGRALVSRETLRMANSSTILGRPLHSDVTRIVYEIHQHPAMSNTIQEVGTKVTRLAETYGLRASWGHFDTFYAVVNETLLRDGKRAVFAVLFVLVFIFWRTNSVLISAGAMLCILASFPISAWIYRAVFDIQWVGVFTFISLFLTVGIGIDDVFVALDHWEKAPIHLHDSIYQRLEWSLEHSIISMGTTSISTMAGFAANMLHPIVPIRLFSITMMTLVGVNYLLVIFVFPSFLVLREGRKNKSSRVVVQYHEVTKDIEEIDQIQVLKEQTGERSKREDECEDSICLLESKPPTSPQKEKRSNPWIELIIQHSKHITILAGIAFLFLSALATRLKGADAIMNLFRPGHNIQRYYEMEKRFDGTGALIEPTLTWGVRPKDVIDKTNPLRSMPLELDESLHLNEEVSQVWLLELCQDLASPTGNAQLRILPGSVSCIHLDLHHWLQVEERKTDSGMFLPRGLPVPQELWEDTVTTFYQSSVLASQYDSRSSPAGIWFHNNKSAVVSISFKSRTIFWESSTVLWEEHEYWRDWLSNRLMFAPTPGLKNGFLGSRKSQWSLVEGLHQLMPSAMLSTVYSGVFVFLALLLGTRNLAVTMLSLLCLVLVFVSFLAFMVVADWHLNMVESCCVGLLFGISVDYIAHVAIGFVNTPEEEIDDETNEEAQSRCRYALSLIGSSVLSGMITTVGASLILWTCEILILVRFGVFIAFTLVTAFVVATAVFPSIAISMQIMSKKK